MQLRQGFLLYPCGEHLAKATNAQIRERIEQVKSMIIDGFTRYAILEHCRKTWGVKRASTDNYIAAATEEIEEEFTPIREKEIAKHLARHDRLYRHSLAKKDYRTALAVDDSAVKLKGLIVDKKEVGLTDAGIDRILSATVNEMEV